MQAAQCMFSLFFGFIGDKAVASGVAFQRTSLVEKEVKFLNVAILLQYLNELEFSQAAVKIPDPYSFVVCLVGQWFHGQRYSGVHF